MVALIRACGLIALSLDLSIQNDFAIPVKTYYLIKRDVIAVSLVYIIFPLPLINDEPDHLIYNACKGLSQQHLQRKQKK